MQRAAIRSIAFAVALAGSATAGAMTPTELGTLGFGATAFNAKVIDGPPPVAFDNFFSFDLPASGGSAFGVLNFPISELHLNLAFSSLELFSLGADGVIGGTGVANDDVLRAFILGGTGTSSLSLDMGPTASPEQMYLRVRGFTTGSEGGLYSGAISVSPVPEPEVWVMMVVGAGLVGFRLRHRSKKIAANRFSVGDAKRRLT